MYLPTADAVVALDAASGRQIWRTPVSGGAPSRRGLWYWPGDGTIAARIFIMSGRRLMALDARDGTAGCRVREWRHRRHRRSVQLGTRHLSQRDRRGRQQPSWHPGAIGNPRAYDARTGAKLWEFSSVAQPGAPGHDTWEGESWKGRLGVNAWPFYFTVRRGARPPLCAARITDSGRLRRRPQRRQSVRQFRRCGRRADRRLQVALPDDPPRPLGSRSARAAGAVRCGPQRSNHSRARR